MALNNHPEKRNPTVLDGKLGASAQ